MKKLVLATAIAALSVTAAQAAPTVYGKAYLSLDTATSKTDGLEREDIRTELNSNGSRIGVKGSEALTENTDVVYQLEYGVKVDDNSTQFTSRDTYLGLSNKKYGTVLAGRLTAIDDRVNYANVLTGGVIGLEDKGNRYSKDGILATFDGDRANNAIAYVSPTYNGLTASAMYVMDEKSEGHAVTESLKGDAFGVAVQYEPANQPFRAGISYIQASNFNTDVTVTPIVPAEKAVKIVRVSGAFDATPALTVGALFQNTDVNTDNDEQTFALSGQYKTQTPWTAYGQVDVVNNFGGEKDDDAQRYTVGGKYAFTKATTGHVYGAFVNQTDASDAKKRYTGIGAGLEHKF